MTDKHTVFFDISGLQLVRSSFHAEVPLDVISKGEDAILDYGLELARSKTGLEWEAQDDPQCIDVDDFEMGGCYD